MELYAAGEIPGFMYLYIGEEAVAVGTCSALEEDCIPMSRQSRPD